MYTTSLLFAIPFMLIAMWAQFNVSNTFKKYERIANRRGMTGAEAAKYILSRYQIRDVEVEIAGGYAGDHYDPTAKKIRLSHGNYNSPSLLAVAVAAHEAGHAIQHATGYAPIKMRWALLPIANIGSKIALPLAIGGMIFGMLGLLDLGIIFYTGVVLFQVLTLPIEFDASKRAMVVMAETNILDPTETPHAKKILGAAAMTYVAAAGVAVGELLRLLVLRGAMGDRD